MLKSSLNLKTFSVWSMAVPLHLLTPPNKHCGRSETSTCMPLSTYLSALMIATSLHKLRLNPMHGPSWRLNLRRMLLQITSVSTANSTTQYMTHPNLLLEYFSSVCLALITHKEKPTLMEIITAVKEHEVHMVITNHLPTATSGSNDITGKNLYFAGKQCSGSKGGYEGQPQNGDGLRELKRYGWCLLLLQMSRPCCSKVHCWHATGSQGSHCLSCSSFCKRRQIGWIGRWQYDQKSCFCQG